MLIAVLLGYIWKHSVYGEMRKIMSFCSCKKKQTGIQLLTNALQGGQVMEAEALSWVAGCDTTCMDKIFLCLCLKYSTSNRDGAGRIVIWIDVITQKTPALPHFISPDFSFTEPSLYSNSNRPNVFNILLFNELCSFFKRIGWYVLTYPNPASHQGYVEALSHTIASLSLQISYQVFFAALLLWVCENAQLILCCLAPCHIFCTSPIPWLVLPTSRKFLGWHDSPACKYTYDKSWWQSICEECKVFCLSPSATAALRGVSFPVQLGGMLLHHVKCWEPPLQVFTVKFLLFFLVRPLKPEVYAQICLDIKAMVQGTRAPHCPLMIQQILCPHGDDLCLQVLTLSETASGISLWLVHLLLYPLLIKSASFPSLCHDSCSHSLQASTYSRTKRHWAMFWIRCYESSWRYLSLPIDFMHFALWLRMAESKNPLAWNENKFK